MLAWESDTKPLMLAPMQGLTNRGLRSLFIDLVRPDVVFTEYVQVQSGGRKVISKNDRMEIQETADNVPLVVQLIGSDVAAMVTAAGIAQELGAEHININLGCPYGRMGKRSAGGRLLQDPSGLARLLAALRPEISGSFSLKLRAGFEDPAELFSLLPLFEDSGVDFLIVHARTVAQRYSGSADHTITAEVVQKTDLPVIANGDIFTTADGLRVQKETNAAGLMLGRGAIGDPFLFLRLRGQHPAASTLEQR
ncbi:MAG: tRNA-dihydrouridine synthase family protein, partial [Desulfobulbaceae bacterium]|nr:tRNA-dihydrouridine synthase family protein [Desulfobulbaceae bacterium]